MNKTIVAFYVVTLGTPTLALLAYATDKLAQHQFRRSKEYPQFEEQQKRLLERIEQIEVFPDSLEDFKEMKGQHYQAIDVAGADKFLTEQSIGNSPERPSLKTLLKFETAYGIREPGMLEQAARLGAEAIVAYRSNPAATGLNYKMGLPIKMVIEQ